MTDFSIDQIPVLYRAILSAADLCVFNLEGPIGEPGPDHAFTLSQRPLRERLYQHFLKLIGHKQYIVHSTPRILDMAQFGTQTLLCLANNHVKDLGPQGLTDTLAAIDAAGIPAIGAGWSIDEANAHYETTIEGRPVIVVNVNKVGLKKASLYIDIYGARSGDYGAASISYPALVRKVSDLRRTHPNAVILCSVHDGRDAAGSVQATDIPVDQLQALRSAGADVVVTHHSHYAVRDAELEAQGIFFLGDLLFLRPDPAEQQRPGSFLEIDIDGEDLRTTLHEYTFTGGIPATPAQ